MVAHGHVVQSQQENELIALYLVSLYLIKHGLGFLKKNQGFFVLLLCDEVDGRLVELVNYDWHLVFFKVQVFVIVFFKRVFDD